MSHQVSASHHPFQHGVLYDYHRSSACYRVRIALHLLDIPYQKVSVNLLESEQTAAGFINPMHAVPFWQDEHIGLSQSLAIIEYLNESVSEDDGASLLPDDRQQRAQCRALAQIVACDIHPLNNLRVLKYLAAVNASSDDANTATSRSPLDLTDSSCSTNRGALTNRSNKPMIDRQHWYHHWLAAGFNAYEANLSDTLFSCGDVPTLADVCLIPQLYNARRFAFSLDSYPKIQAIETRCLQLPAFINAQPEVAAEQSA
uniref:glutathione S-transferase N-terminal domain-containing protein n=1 Tax=Thaumasiovibrio occultus TaxID=1891184 RepID=UPI000B35C148|nr:glutathione S-transferase N-terminal domain-containing protein [Thaumasiovibrio occultus]